MAKYAAALRGGHRVVPLISEVWGGFAVDAMSFLRDLAIARGDTLDVERLSTTWAAKSFMSYYGQRLSVAVTVGVAIEIAAYARGLAYTLRVWGRAAAKLRRGYRRGRGVSA